ncbi:MAG: threonine synthase [Oscillospiraceae bacterium]|nr:threonine synthase [Candidatus Equicaccousia limihippi]
MNYSSTRNHNLTVSSAKAIATGLAGDGGLFLPVEIPALTSEDFKYLKGCDYKTRAKEILGRFLTDFSDDELEYCCGGAYLGNFDNDMPAPVKKLDEQKNVLELWHGPTCAFKDLALQILPYLMTVSVKKTGSKNKTVILVATSGDTGKAALEGFCDVDGTAIMVFYPTDGVSNMQKMQMATQKGSNVNVCAINGNFDDAQSGVKQIFGNEECAKLLENNGCSFSSANSINWGRLAPQIVYYISAYLDMDCPKEMNVVVPTGNFGNILAAYYAKEMGVPIKKLICASNSNNVLTDFINTGVYNKNRDFYTTVSPSMDILISSNLERLLYLLSGDDTLVSSLMEQLKTDGKYTVPADLLAKLQQSFCGGYCNEEKTLQTIKDTFDKYGYLIDTHTAVAMAVANDYAANTGDTTPMLIVSTASPYKFSPAVCKAVGAKTDGDEFKTVENLEKATDTIAPAPIKDLKNKEIRFKTVVDKENMTDEVLKFLGIK